MRKNVRMNLFLCNIFWQAANCLGWGFVLSFKIDKEVAFAHVLLVRQECAAALGA